jgi:solute carrier family 25 (mitochondrial carnitine/acylcarnitine transporter), member 20/29
MGGGSELQRLSASENLILGMTAGVCCKACNYPLLNWKNTVQQGLKIDFNPKVVYRGLPMAMLNLGGTTAIQFWFTGFFLKMLSGGNTGNLSKETTTQAAFLGGLFSGIPCSLYELTMIQQQRFGGSIIGTPVRLVKSFGASILGRGVTMTMGRESLYTMAMLGVTPLIQSMLMEKYEMETSMALATGSLTGAFISATVTHPMDTIKTCMQGDCEGNKYKGIMQTGRALASEYGVAKGLFKGLSWRIGLISTTFFLVNKFKEKLAPVMFPAPVDNE